MTNDERELLCRLAEWVWYGTPGRGNDSALAQRVREAAAEKQEAPPSPPVASPSAEETERALLAVVSRYRGATTIAEIGDGWQAICQALNAHTAAVRAGR